MGLPTRDSKIEAFLASKLTPGTIKARTANEYRRDLERFGRFLDHRNAPYYRLYDASDHDVRRFLAHVREDNQVNSTRRKLAALKEFYKFLERDGYRKDNPAEDVELPEGPRRNKAMLVLSRSEIQRLLESPHGTFELRDKAMLHFLYSGPKRAELAEVRVGDVDLDARRIKLRGRIVPLRDSAFDAIRAYLEVRPRVKSVALFITKRGSGMSVRQAWVIVKKYVRECGLSEATDLEAIRASYAVHALEDGVWFMDVLEGLGNVNTITLQNYARMANVKPRRPLAGVDSASTTQYSDFVQLLHDRVVESSLRHFNDNDYREAVLNSMLALTELIRTRTGLDGDGASLVSRAFKPEKPLLTFADLRSVSGRDEHEGFHKIMLGAFQGVRNPKSHTFASDLTAETAAQYLVFISLLVRKVEEASEPLSPLT